MAPKIHEYISGQIWLCAYPVKYLGMKFHARMTIIRLADGKLMLHSPCEVDDLMRPMLGEIGEVAYIVAPGTFHHMHVASAQAAFPEAKTFICPGLESKRPSMRFDFLLGDVAPAVWAGQFDQAVVRGNRWISEVAFFHRTTKTLILVDLVENYGDASTEVDWLLKLWWRFVLHMWNTPRPAPEYQLGWSDKRTARASLQSILRWDFERVIIAHGDLIEGNAKQVVEEAWQKILAAA